MRKANNMQQILSRCIFWLVLMLFLLFILIPMFWVMGASLRPNTEIFTSSIRLSWNSFIPSSFTFEPYIHIFTVRTFGRSMFNTLIICALTVFIGIAINAPAGLIFAKYQFRAKELLFIIIMISFMVPFEAVAIPSYQLITRLHMEDTYAALIAPAVANGLIVFLFRQFFAEIPDSMLEAATIDGAGFTRILTRIVIPLSIPVIISAGLMIFIWQWESFLWPLVVARKDSLRMIQIALGDFRTEHSMLWNEMMAACVVSLLIPIAILMPFQKYYVQGIATSGMKE